ncbi:MAG: DUF4424 family protein [Acidobacteriaceae bacterium]|jgi:hypothetical protein
MRFLPLLALSAFLVSSASLADDGAASIAAGGIVMTREPRITMAKEVLTISESKVIVDYDFRNDTDSDITTVVAFPIPPYSLDFVKYSIKEQGFEDFKLVIDGKPARFQTEAKATLGHRDVTPILNRYGIDVATFGHFDEDHNQSRDIRRLSPSQRSALIAAGLLDKDPYTDWASWTVEKKYYWTQTFPAHTVVRISHTYIPVVGFDMVPEDVILAALSPRTRPANVQKGEESVLSEIQSVCPTGDLLKTVETAIHQNPDNPYGHIEYVDFILTSANTWKTPIEDFTLIVERPHMQQFERSLVSLCWNGPVTTIDPNHFSVHARRLVPTQELRIGFASLYSGPQKP